MIHEATPRRADIVGSFMLRSLLPMLLIEQSSRHFARAVEPLLLHFARPPSRLGNTAATRINPPTSGQPRHSTNNERPLLSVHPTIGRSRSHQRMTDRG